MGVSWEDGRLAARTLHAALRAAGLDPARQCFHTIFHTMWNMGCAARRGPLGRVRKAQSHSRMAAIVTMARKWTARFS